MLIRLIVIILQYIQIPGISQEEKKNNFVDGASDTEIESLLGIVVRPHKAPLLF